MAKNKILNPGRALAFVVALTVGIPAVAERAPIPSRLVQEAVTRAATGWQIAGVRLLTPADASEPGPVLTVDQLKFDPTRNWLQARVRCQSTEICVPFYAVAVASAQPKSSSTPVNRPSPPASAPVLVKRGAHVTLTLVNESSRITMPVECLENGVLGQRVRLRTDDHREYQAEVVDRGQLRARF